VKVLRMTFDIAVEGDAPCVYELQTSIVKSIAGTRGVIGAEPRRENCLTANGIDASDAIDRQKKGGVK